MRQPEMPPSARLQAIAILLDRGWGKPPQSHTGENGKGDIQVIIRHIVDGRAASRVDGNAEQRVIEHVPIDATPDDADEP